MSNSASNSQSGITSTKQVETSAHIDWISVTYPHAAIRENGTRGVLADDYNDGFKVVRGTMGYLQARQYKSGAIMQWHDKHPSMGVHVTYTAQALRYASENFGLDQVEILEALSQYGRVSRCDLCVDVLHAEIDIEALYKQAKSGVIKSRAKQMSYIEQAKSGNEKGARTFYIGSMTKRKKLLRVYDKGAQLNLDHYLTRFELETHGLPAQSAVKGITENAEKSAQAIRDMIAGYADFSDSLVGQYLTSNNPIKLSHPKYQKSDTAKWLIEVVAKTLAKEAHRDYNMLSEFMQSFTYHYEQLTASERYENE